MQIGFIQMFDKEADAIEALGFITDAFPNYNHQLVKTCNQVQLQTSFGGETKIDSFGDLNENVVYLVTSLP